jgi:hypothetical protein
VRAGVIDGEKFPGFSLKNCDPGRCIKPERLPGCEFTGKALCMMHLVFLGDTVRDRSLPFPQVRSATNNRIRFMQQRALAHTVLSRLFLVHCVLLTMAVHVRQTVA